MSESIRLEFSDFVDLQTRLVLLPRVEEEGIGATVAAYKPLGRRPEKENEAPEGRGEEELTPRTKCSSEGAKSDSLPGADSIERESSVSLEKKDPEVREDADAIVEEKKDEASEDTVASVDDSEVPAAIASDSSSEDFDCEERDIVGLVLSGITSTESGGESWYSKDFTSILASIREAPTPIVLHLSTPEEGDSSSDDSTNSETVQERTDDDASTISSAHPENSDENDTGSMSPTSTNKSLGGRFANWGSQLRATSAILAAEAASGAAHLSTAVKSAAAERSAKGVQSTEEGSHMKKANLSVDWLPERPSCSIFIQCNSGKFVPIPEKSPATGATSLSSTESTPRITTSSLLVVRLSPSQACPTKGLHFQWHRSCENPSDSSMSSSSAGTGSHQSHDNSHGRESIASTTTEWTILSGATYAAYHPNATDVGHRLRCEVTGDGVLETTNDDSDYTTICETHEVVAADMSLFIGARQALGRGAHFGNLHGRGNAEGRTFRLHVEISRVAHPGRRAMDVASALSIYQVSGETAEKIHEEPIVRPMAVAYNSQPKAFDLVFPCDSSSMLYALSTNGRFQLQAPNRITRETFLLSLGIANHQGRPVNLDVTTVLFPGASIDSICEIVSEAVVERTPTHSNRVEADHFFTPLATSSALKDTTDVDSLSDDHVKKLELELQALRSRLVRKDRVISDLQRQVTQSEKLRQKSESELSCCREDLEKSHKECRDTYSGVRLAEKRNETHSDTVQRLKGDNARHVASLEGRLSSQSKQIATLEKNVRSLQNEKAVLSAAVEARDSKVAKMTEMQKVVDCLSDKVSRGDALRTELNDMSQRYAEISREMEKVSRFERECRDELEETRKTTEELNGRLAKEQKKTACCQTQLESLQLKIQQLKAERNSYKQKAESLSKEVSRICRHGRSLNDVEKMIGDEESRRMEVSLLKSQKRQALQDLHHYRTSYEQSQIAQQRAGVDGEAMRALEQKAEMERVVAEMTEYLQAKEMQLETLRQVNQALTEELHELAKANMSQNDI